MIRTIREFFCKKCGYIRTLLKGETIDICPACQDGENKIYQWDGIKTQPWEIDSDPCANCNVRKQPGWNGVCYYTIPYM